MGETRRSNDHNHRLVWPAAPMSPTPGEPRSGRRPLLTGAMRCVALPADFAVDAETAHALRWRLAEEDRVQVPIIPFAGRLWARLSAQVYNTMEDYARLAAAVARRRV